MGTPSTDRPLAAPQVDAATEHFWNAAREDQLCTRRCKSCGKLHW